MAALSIGYQSENKIRMLSIANCYVRRAGRRSIPSYHKLYSCFRGILVIPVYRAVACIIVVPLEDSYTPKNSIRECNRESSCSIACVFYRARISPLSKEMNKMEETTYLFFGTDQDKRNPSKVREGVTDAIIEFDRVAISYGVEFSDAVIKQLYDELGQHIAQMSREK